MHVPDSGKLLIHHHHIFRENTHAAGTHSKSEMVAYQGGIDSVGVGIVIIPLCDTNITSNILYIFKQCSLDCGSKKTQRDANLCDISTRLTRILMGYIISNIY